MTGQPPPHEPSWPHHQTTDWKQPRPKQKPRVVRENEAPPSHARPAHQDGSEVRGGRVGEEGEVEGAEIDGGEGRREKEEEQLARSVVQPSTTAQDRK